MVPCKYCKAIIRFSQSLLQAEKKHLSLSVFLGVVLQPSDHLSGTRRKARLSLLRIWATANSTPQTCPPPLGHRSQPQTGGVTRTVPSRRTPPPTRRYRPRPPEHAHRGGGTQGKASVGPALGVYVSRFRRSGWSWGGRCGWQPGRVRRAVEGDSRTGPPLESPPLSSPCARCCWPRSPACCRARSPPPAGR